MNKIKTILYFFLILLCSLSLLLIQNHFGGTAKKIHLKYFSEGDPLVEIKIHKQKCLCKLRIKNDMRLEVAQQYLNLWKKTSYNPKEFAYFYEENGIKKAYEIFHLKEKIKHFENEKISLRLSSEPMDHFNISLKKMPFLLLDFKKNCFFMTKDPKQIKREEYFLKNMKKFPFQFDNGEIIISMKTDWGMKKLILAFTDKTYLNGESCNKSDLNPCQTKIWAINNVFYPPQNILFKKFPDVWDYFDGLLGMDFLKGHVLYIDSLNKVLYMD